MPRFSLRFVFLLTIAAAVLCRALISLPQAATLVVAILSCVLLPILGATAWERRN